MTAARGFRRAPEARRTPAGFFTGGGDARLTKAIDPGRTRKRRRADPVRVHELFAQDFAGVDGRKIVWSGHDMSFLCQPMAQVGEGQSPANTVAPINHENRRFRRRARRATFRHRARRATLGSEPINQRPRPNSLQLNIQNLPQIFSQLVLQTFGDSFPKFRNLV